MYDMRFDTPGVDDRFPSPGVDTRFPSPGVDTRFSEAGLDARFDESQWVIASGTILKSPPEPSKPVVSGDTIVS